MANDAATLTSANERADALEHQMMQDLDRVIVRSVLFTSGDKDPTGPLQEPLPAGKHLL